MQNIYIYIYSSSDLKFIPPQSRHELHSHSFILNYSSFPQSTLKTGIFLANIVVNSLCSVLHKYLEGNVNHTGPRANSVCKRKKYLECGAEVNNISYYYFFLHTAH